jgi:hypothetical protein
MGESHRPVARASRSGVLGALALAACGGGTQAVLTLPDRPGARALVLGLAGDAPTLEALPLPLTGTVRSTYRVEAALEGRLQALLLAESLGEAGIDPGPLTLASYGEAGRPLVGEGGAFEAPLAVLTASLEGREAAWTEGPTLRPELAALRIPRPQRPCEPFPPAAGVWSFDTALRWWVPVGPEHLLVGSLDGVLLFDGEGPRPWFTGEVRDFSAAVAGPGGAILLADVSGQLWRGEAAGALGLRRLAPHPAPSLRGTVLALAAGGPDDLFALLLDGRLLHWDGSSWAESAIPRSHRGGLVWTGPAEAALLADGVGEYLRAVRGRVVAAEGPSTGLTSLARIPGFGLVAGSSDGELFARVERGWQELGTPGYGWWMLATAPRADGLFFFLASGMVGSLSAAGDLCEDLGSSGIVSRGALVPLERDLWLLTSSPSGEVWSARRYAGVR